MYNMKYNNELDKYAKAHKLYISNELKSVDPEYIFKHNASIRSFLKNQGLIGAYSTVVNHVIVKWKDETILEVVTKGVIDDDDLLKMIKREINLIKLDI